MSPAPRHFSFQLTPRCNLHCSFCGQNRGMRASAPVELTVDTWLELARQAAELAAPAKAAITLWGGEPLLYPGFDILTEKLAAMPGISLQLITNGTMLDRHADIVNQYIDSIFVSIEGDRELTDAARGKGTFDQLCRNLPLLRERRGTLALMSVISDSNVARMTEIPDMLAQFAPDRVILSQLMYLRDGEIRRYREESLRRFGCDYPELQQWQREDDAAYIDALKKGVEKLKSREYPFPVVFTPHLYPWTEDAPPCRAPWTRIHIRNDGACGFCTDYFGFNAGNATQMTLREIFHSEAAEAFRNAARDSALPICRHCPWRIQNL